MTAAGSRLPLADPRKSAKVAGRRFEWQRDAWNFFDLMPEVKFTTWWAGNALSQVRLIAAVEVDPDPADTGRRDPIPVSNPDSGISAATAAAANDEMARLRSARGGQGGILRDLSMNIDIAGEAWLIGYGARPASVDLMGNVVTPAALEDWDVKSVDEVQFDATGVRVLEFEGDRGRLLDPVLDTAIRIWQQHPRWGSWADSNMRAMLGDCEALLTFEAEIMAVSRSHHNAGVFALPWGLSMGPKDAQPQAADGDTTQTDPLTAALIEGWTTPVDDPQEPSAVAPSILRGGREDLAAARWIDTGRKASTDLDNRIETRVKRLARGLNAPVEVVMGHQATTFANAEQIDEDEFEDFHRPRLVLQCEGITVGYLRPNLLARGCDPVEVAQVVAWFDPSALLAEPDMGPIAAEAHAALAISDDAYRGYRGLKESDAPTIEELLRRAVLTARGALTGDIAGAIIKLLDPSLEFDPLPVAVPEATPADGGTEPAAAVEPAADAAIRHAFISALVIGTPADRRDRMAATLGRYPTGMLGTLVVRARRPMMAAGRPTRARSQVGRQLMDIDRDLRTRLLAAADTHLDVALEKAGNRIKARAGVLRDLTTDVPARLRASVAGRALIAHAGLTDDDLLSGAFDAMRDQFMTWGAQAQSDAMNVVGKLVGGFSTEERDALGLRQATDLDEAWTWMQGALTSLAHAKLYDPAPDTAAELGEISTTTVPPGLIRQAMARAGGATSLETTPGGGAFVTLSDAGTRPAGGIGTGDLLRSTMRDHGAGIDGYEWVYGAAARKSPFEAHADLDGTEFTTFDDPVLANADSFPATDFYLPGDHDGCLCDVSPIILSPTDVAGLGLDVDDADETDAA